MIHEMDNEAMSVAESHIREIAEAESTITEQLEDAQEALKNREKLLNTVNRVAETLLSVEDDAGFDSAILWSMEMIGLCLDADRVNLMLVTVDEDSIGLSLDSQWCSEHGMHFQQMNLGQKIPRGVLLKCEEIIFGGISFNGSLTALPAIERNALDPAGAIKSVVIIPIFYQEQIWGIFSIDNCMCERILTNEEMSILHSACLMITSIRYRMAQNRINKEIELAIAQAHDALKNREKLLSVVNQAAALLLAVDGKEGLDSAVMQSMELICLCLDVDQMSLYRIVVDPDEIVLDKINEWLSEIGSRKIKIDAFTKVPTEVLMSFGELLSKGECFNGPMSMLPAEGQSYINPNDAVKSGVIIPLLFEEQIWGLICIGDCKGGRIFANEEMDILRSASLMIASALRRVDQAAEMYRIEIAEESNRAKSRFLARVSHEIRTPISAVMGISEIQLQNPDLLPNVEEAFAKIHNSSNLLLVIINDILDHSKIESGKMLITESEYEVASLVSDVAHLYLLYLGSKDIKFRIQVDENLPASLIGDVLRIEQITSNLLSNSFKYTMSGTVELSLQGQKDESRDGYISLVITISDTGLGMTPEQLENLYNEYERFHMNELHSVTGTGLGMSIVYGLVQMMDAELNIESEIGKGTKAVVRIPQKIADSKVIGKELSSNLQRFEEYTHAVAKRFNFEPEPMPYGKVLVVDDVEANLYVARGLLDFYDLNVEVCDSGYEAIDRIKQGEVYDIIFMDHMMPDLDGFETMRILRDMGYTQPIIALTANALIGQAEKFIKGGFDGFISKPIQTKLLNTTLIKHIKDKQSAEVIKAARANDSLERANHKNINDYQNDSAVQEKLRKEFAISDKNTFPEIIQALSVGDTKKACLLAHTLKGVAGLMHETELMKAASDVEQLLMNDEIPPDELLSTLENELNHVLKSTVAPVPLAYEDAMDSDEAKALLDELETLLENSDATCIDFSDKLRKIPEAAILARQIEVFDFVTALKSLKTLKDIL